MTTNKLPQKNSATAAHKSFAHLEKTEREIQHDSATNVYIHVPMDRVVVSIRCRREIKDALKQFCQTNGQSICHVFEGLAIGFLQGINQQIESVNKSPTMNVSIVRHVRRLRRCAVEEDETEVVSVPEVCAVCGKTAFAMAIDSDGPRLLCKSDFLKAKCKLSGWKELH